jgi:hypothetical protein
MVVLSGLFSWNSFLSGLLFGNVMAALIFYCFGPEGRNLIGPVINLSLLMGPISLVAAIIFRQTELGVIKHIERKLKAGNDLELTNKEVEIFKTILTANKISLEASEKYKNILLYENKTMNVVFKDLKDNILAYFQHKSVEHRTKLTIVNARHKVLHAGLPLNFFYRTVYSVIANVFHCNDGAGEISVRFCCDSSARIESIEISHGDHGRLRISDRARYFPGSYPDNILGWDILIRLFEQLEIKVTEGNKKLKITFPSESEQNNNNIVDFKELLENQLETV